MIGQHRTLERSHHYGNNLEKRVKVKKSMQTIIRLQENHEY